MSDVVAIILARGGSKGVPLKNLQTVGGLSLLARAIRTTQAALVRSPATRGNQSVPPVVYVSTDCPMIAAEALANRAEVISRPKRLAEDDTEGLDALRHAIGRLPSSPSIVALVQCTAPLMTATDVERTCHALECGYDLTVCSVPFDGVVFSSYGKPLTWQPGSSNRQQRDQMRRVAGSVWAFAPEYAERDWYSGLIGMVPSEVPVHLEIDTEADLEIARRLVGPGIVPSGSSRSNGVLCEVAGCHDGHMQRWPETAARP